MSDMQVFKIIKTIPGNLLLQVSPLSNQSIKKEIYLTNRLPQQSLPVDWVLGIFLDPSLYDMYKKQYFTFSDNDAAVKAAVEAGVYFDEVLDFTPADTDRVKEVSETLRKGNRSAIVDAIKEHGEVFVKEIAISIADELSVGVVNMLQNLLKIQLIANEE